MGKKRGQYKKKGKKPVLTAAQLEAKRKSDIRRNMGANLAKKSGA